VAPVTTGIESALANATAKQLKSSVTKKQKVKMYGEDLTTLPPSSIPGWHLPNSKI
jgi:hypothetical protein